MYVLLGLGFVLILLGIVAGVVFIALYNTLIHLYMTCQNTAEDLCRARAPLGEKTSDASVKELINACTKASTLDRQVVTLNKLRECINASSSGEKKTYTHKEHTLQTEKRFFNNTARELSDRLSSFPTKTIGSVFGIKAPKLLDLDEDAKTGIIPEAKYL